jgi:hypothetical protein
MSLNLQFDPIGRELQGIRQIFFWTCIQMFLNFDRKHPRLQLRGYVKGKYYIFLWNEAADAYGCDPLFRLADVHDI